jgi:hypothetical protein
VGACLLVLALALAPAQTLAVTELRDLECEPASLTIYTPSQDNISNECHYQVCPRSIATGDLNDDGFDDLIIGTDGLSTVNIIFGEADMPPVWDLAYFPPDVRIVGDFAATSLGYTVFSGDLDRDGFDDVVMGARVPSRLYILFGKEDWPDRVIRFADTPPDTLIVGDGMFGTAIAMGDINNDGREDLIVGAPRRFRASAQVGGVYVFRGRPTWPATLDIANEEESFRLWGVGDGDHLGSHVASGDVNDDGIDDLLVTAAGADGPLNNRPGCTETHVIFGDASLMAPPPTVIERLASESDVMIQGEWTSPSDPSDLPTVLAADSADVNDDGVEDILLSCGQCEALGREGSGIAYVVYGGSHLTTPTAIDLLVNGPDLVLHGPAESLGLHLPAAGDWSGDGIADFLMGVPGSTRILEAPAGPNRGGVYRVDGDAALPAEINLYGVAPGAQVVPSHEGGEAGSFSLALGDLDGDADPDLVFRTANVTCCNPPRQAQAIQVVFGEKVDASPVSDTGGPYWGHCHDSAAWVDLDGSGSYDPNPGDTLEYFWETDCPGVTAGDPTQAVMTLEFTNPDCAQDCTVTLTVTDPQGNTDVSTATVTMQPFLLQAPRSGQTAVRATGDDGDLQAGFPWPSPRFTDHGNGTATDLLTGMMYPVDAGPARAMQWDEALEYVEGMNQGANPNFGHTDWRLPNAVELRSLLDSGHLSPSLPSDHPFVDVRANYWTSSTDVTTPGQAYRIDVSSGQDYSTPKTNNVFVLPVRGASGEAIHLPTTGQASSYASGDDGDLLFGKAWPSPRFRHHRDGTITDYLTGLMFARKGTRGESDVNWQGALDLVAEMNSGLRENFGYTDWRLPNRVELKTLADVSQYRPAFDSCEAPFVHVRPFYWSSTSPLSSSAYAWDARTGAVLSFQKTQTMAVWPVRTALEYEAPPICDAGEAYGGECPGPAIDLPLDGGGSSHPDGLPLQYAWSTDCPGIMDDPTSVTPVLSLTLDACPTECSVTLVVTDPSSRSDTCSAPVRVADNRDPQISGVPTDAIIECGNPVPPPASPTVTDQCDPDPLVEFDEERVDQGCRDCYVLTRTWTVTDWCGHQESDSRVLTIQDTTPPLSTGILDATYFSPCTVTLDWPVDDDCSGILVHEIWRSTVSPVQTIPANHVASVPTFPHADTVEANGTYFYLVRAVNGLAMTLDSNEAPVIVGACTGRPEEVEILRLSCASGVLEASWDPAAAADSYNVYRGSLASLAAGSYDHTEVGACGIPGTTDSSLSCEADGNGYYYLVVGDNIIGEGSYGTSSSAVPRDTALSPCP